MGRSVKPLKDPQKQFLQRFLALHVITNDEAQSLWDEISQGTDDRRMLGRDLNHTLGVINRSLSDGFGLEVRTATLALDLGDSPSEEKLPSSGKRPTYTRYHAIVNRDEDDIAKRNANPAMSKGGGVHEMALFRLILERLVESSLTSSEGDNSASAARGIGCQASMSRMDMLNLRTDLTGHHSNKLGISQTEKSLSLLESEGWLAPARGLDNDDDSSTEERPRKKK
uniref:Non-structural maintenance of chromosomes element 1 homolog n=1 Tax=Eucampia antarctica TaxID=49252 RepID=A0A7S2VZ15_9STRA|mmetsp:Transcript_11009/g.10527  ORF Transcript_11009/g.10527 Transcript_11009/m.10527 type:complete len:226 (+) Transcript_11009:117-794(+)